jgi:hypothetical protein
VPPEIATEEPAVPAYPAYPALPAPTEVKISALADVANNTATMIDKVFIVSLLRGL